MSGCPQETGHIISDIPINYTIWILWLYLAMHTLQMGYWSKPRLSTQKIDGAV